MGNGNGAFYTDSIIIKHKVDIGNASIKIADYIEIAVGGKLYSSSSNNDLTILETATAINNDSIDLRNVNIEGLLTNNHYILTVDMTISDEGYLHIGTDAYVQTTNPANNQGVIFNMGTLYSPSNFINNNGTITGNGGTYLVDGNLTNNAGAVATCSGGPINICRTNGTNPTINGSGTIDSGCVMICGVLLGGSLPVELISFNADFADEVVTLQWVTGTEINNHYFEIQRSYDGANWETIDKVYSKVTNSSETQYYVYSDKTRYTEKMIIYYRLKQVDTDGKFECLPIAHVTTGSNNDMAVNVFPNPASDNIGVQISNLTKGATCEIVLTDMFGAIVHKNNVEGNFSLTNISSSEIPVGLYYVIVRQGNTETVKKVMVQR